MRPTCTVHFAFCGISLLTASSGLAQQVAPASAAPLQEVVVTAEKSSQSLQNVPAAVTALSGTQLTQVGITDVAAVEQVAPSLAIVPIRSFTLIFMRGVGQTLTTPNSDPVVAINLNGAYEPSQLSSASLYDVDRVEVLYGPQGTLYGQNAAGGVINVITRKPGSAFSAEGNFEYGNFNRIEGVVAFDAPITQKFAVRTALNVIRHDGYYDNGSNAQDTTSGRVTAEWRPSDTTRVIAIGSYSHDGGYGDVNQTIPPRGDPWHLAFDPGTQGYGTNIGATQASLEIDQRISSHFDLTYVGGYNYEHVYQSTALWGGPPPAPIVNHQATTENSQELRLNAHFERVSALAGLYYYDERSGYTADVKPLATVEALNGPFVATSRGSAAFFQLTYSLLDGLRLTAGARYTHIAKSLHGENTTILGGLSPNTVDYAGSEASGRGDWKGGIEYDLARDSMLYASVATGFSPGGFSTAPVARGSTQAAPFLPMEVTAYTLGWKNELADRRIIADLEAFHYDYKNYQVSQRNPITSQNQVYNAPRSRIDGAQLDLAFVLTARDRLTLSTAYLRAKAQQLTTPAGNFDGYTLPYSPGWTVNGSLRHEFSLGNGGRVVALADTQFVSGQWAFYTHATGGYISPYTRTNLDLTYYGSDGHWSVGLWGRNIENSLILTAGIAGAIPGPAAFDLEAPRTYGIRFAFQD